MRQAAQASLAAVSMAIGALSPSIATAQQPQPAKPLQFEVATIKPGNPQPGVDWSSSGGSPGGQFRMVNAPLKQWVKMGLSVKDYALRAPSWLDTPRFDLLAKLPTDKPADQKATAEMMKELLIERFGLKWHEELQTVSGYELVADRKVLVQPSSGLLARLGRHGGSSSGPTSIQGTNSSMSDFAETLGEVLRRPVVDATHLSGGYDFKVVFRAIDDAAVAQAKGFGMKDVDIDSLPSIFDALREQLGLRLQSARVPSKVIVVDNINRQPTGN